MSLAEAERWCEEAKLIMKEMYPNWEMPSAEERALCAIHELGQLLDMASAAAHSADKRIEELLWEKRDQDCLESELD